MLLRVINNYLEFQNKELVYQWDHLAPKKKKRVRQNHHLPSQTMCIIAFHRASKTIKGNIYYTTTINQLLVLYLSIKHYYFFHIHVFFYLIGQRFQMSLKYSAEIPFKYAWNAGNLQVKFKCR